MDITVMVSWLSGAQVPFTSEYNHYINFLLSSCYWPLLFEFVWIGWCWAWTNKRLRYDYRLRPAMWLSNAQLLNQEAFISQSAAQREGRNVSHNLQLPIPTDCNSAAISQFVHWTHKKTRDFPLVLHEEIPHEPRHYEDFYLYFFDISNGKVVGLIPQEHVNWLTNLCYLFYNVRKHLPNAQMYSW